MTARHCSPVVADDCQIGDRTLRKRQEGPAGQLHSCQVEANSKDEAFVCTFDNAVHGVYKYTIHVVATDGSASPRPLDPTVGND